MRERRKKKRDWGEQRWKHANSNNSSQSHICGIHTYTYSHPFIYARSAYEVITHYMKNNYRPSYCFLLSVEYIYRFPWKENRLKQRAMSAGALIIPAVSNIFFLLWMKENLIAFSLTFAPDSSTECQEYKLQHAIDCWFSWLQSKAAFQHDFWLCAACWHTSCSQYGHNPGQVAATITVYRGY